MRYLGGFDEQSTYSSAQFLKDAVKFFARRGVAIECVQTDNGFEFTNRFSQSKKDRQPSPVLQTQVNIRQIRGS